jgi:hypothetical protein
MVPVSNMITQNNFSILKEKNPRTEDFRGFSYERESLTV